MQPSHLRELRRQLLHIGIGAVLIVLLSFELFAARHVFLLVIIGGMLSVLARLTRIPVVSYVLDKVERPEQMQTFPGRGPLFFMVGALLVLKLFDKDIALASIAILTLGDSLSHLFGVHFGSTKNPFYKHSKKLLEGTVLGAGVAFFGALFFVPPFEALIGSFAAMIAEAIQLELNRRPIDDNFIIPLVAGTVIHLVRAYLPTA